MIDIVYYGAVEKYKTAQQLVIEYRFMINDHPIPVALVVHSDHNNATYNDLLNEALNYAYGMYLLGQMNQGRN